MGPELPKALGTQGLRVEAPGIEASRAVLQPTVNVSVGPSTSRDHGDPEIVRGTTRDERNRPRTDDCTNCTKGSVGPPEAIDPRADPRLPEPDPELFLLAGLSAARAWPRRQGASGANLDTLDEGWPPRPNELELGPVAVRREERDPGGGVKVYGDLEDAVAFVGANQDRFVAEPAIYGSFSEKAKRIRGSAVVGERRSRWTAAVRLVGNKR